MNDKEIIESINKTSARWAGLYRIWDSGNLVFHWMSTGQ